MSMVDLLTTFGGRIDRKSWWIGCVFVLLALVAGSLLLALIYGESATLPSRIWTLIWVVPMTALAVKRFNDRDWPNWLGYMLGSLFAVCLVAGYFDLLGEPANISALGHALLWPLLAFWLFALFDNGLLPGTRGPNQYGPSPNAPRELVP